MPEVMHLIQSGGLALIAAIVFFESGMLIGFFLPGDTLLIGAGVFAAQGKLPLIWTIIVVAIAGIMGDNVGYNFGRRIGPRILARPDGKLYRKAYMERATTFYKKHGRKSMLLAHFVPYVRTFAPVVAGVAAMNRRQYIFYDTIGVVLWATIVTLLGYFVGSRIPDIDQYLTLSLLVVLVVAFGPMFYHIVRNWYKSVRPASSTDTPKDT